MIRHSRSQPDYIYTYVFQEDELELCRLEMRAFFGVDSATPVLRSPVAISPDRSPFMKERIEVLFESADLPAMLKQVEQLELGDATFKVMLVKNNDLELTERLRFENRRAIEREMGMHIHGEADFKSPDFLFGLIPMEGRWFFGHYLQAEPVWLHHKKKPRNYSIALSTRVARAAANIAVPFPEGIRAIDPCCGIGTVLVEARSMGIAMDGRDINPFIVQGARRNLEFFNLAGEVTLGDIAAIEDSYDAAVIDMPYNLFSQTTPEEQFTILREGRRIARRVVVITAEPLDSMIEAAGFTIIDRGVARKGNFSRQLLVCE
jgi:tRNA G10  N-methylase Trm11